MHVHHVRWKCGVTVSLYVGVSLVCCSKFPHHSQIYDFRLSLLNIIFSPDLTMLEMADQWTRVCLLLLGLASVEQFLKSNLHNSFQFADICYCNLFSN